MGKQPAAGGGEQRSRARASGTAPSTRGAAPPPASPARYREESVQGVQHAVAPRDGGAGTSAAVAGARPYYRRITQQEPKVRFGGEQTAAHSDQGRGPHGLEQAPVHGDAGAEAPAKRPGRPSYLPVSQKKMGEGQAQAAPARPAAGHRPLFPAPYAAVPEAPHPTPVVPAGAKPPKTFDNQKTILRTSTINDDDDLTDEQVPSGLRIRAAGPPNETGYAQPAWGERMIHPKEKERQPMAFCFTACCILFWLLVIAVGLAVLIIFLLYHPQSPKMRVTSATLNAGYVDELGGPAGGGARALNADLTVLAAIYNPNTKLHIVLRYMQLDLYFQGSMIATQAVWPAPLHEGPRGNVLRSVHLVVSEVTMTQEDVFEWQNATAKGGPVVLKLAGRFRTQLIFGRWFRFKYWVTPQCTLWLDPPPSGALRRARC
ncbi:hypothetical protein E2562_007525 [Oryza meyeriana var. granulata]|uniref:Late embryogenesis abundant protein LEA-2 subgroup domain-containing protein n=1 Tax=Oryza meyeriana var. granulata TaxID=110450 RepID=A0A6G1DVK6_9ORYZ|nr:hypothetical protein E2562_007525 [Oryza meyeriana var. granulata]